MHRSWLVLVLALAGCPGGGQKRAGGGEKKEVPRVLARGEGLSVRTVASDKPGELRVVVSAAAGGAGVELPVYPVAGLRASIAPFQGQPGLVAITIDAESVRRAERPTAGVYNPSQTTAGERSQTFHLVRTTSPLELACTWRGHYSAYGPYPGMPSSSVRVTPLGDGEVGVLLDVTQHHREHEGQLERYQERIVIPPQGTCTRERITPVPDERVDEEQLLVD